jgi:hypothetical protein
MASHSVSTVSTYQVQAQPAWHLKYLTFPASCCKTRHCCAQTLLHHNIVTWPQTRQVPGAAATYKLHAHWVERHTATSFCVPLQLPQQLPAFAPQRSTAVSTARAEGHCAAACCSCVCALLQVYGWARVGVPCDTC